MQVANENEEVTYCLPHGLEYVKENKSKVSDILCLVCCPTGLFSQVKHCKILYTHTMEEIRDILKKVEERLKTKNFFQVW